MKMKREWQIFADEYLIDCNGTRAYQVAYPNVKKDTARAEAPRILAYPCVKEYIDRRMQEKTDNRIMKQDEILMIRFLAFKTSMKNILNIFKMHKINLNKC